LALREKREGEGIVAVAFFVTLQVVQRRLKVASAAVARFEIPPEDGMAPGTARGLYGESRSRAQVRVSGRRAVLLDVPSTALPTKWRWLARPT